MRGNGLLALIACLAHLALFAGSCEVLAAGRVVHVSAASGNDANDCLAPSRACKTIQRGAGVVRGGDQMLVGPGTYYEFPVLQNLGSSAANPVWIQSEPAGSARISGMWMEAALGQVQWRDDGGGVYSAPHGPGLFGSYNGTYLFRFLSVTDLRNASAGGVQTPPYGIACEGGRVYVKLPGNANPNGRSVLISPPTWGESGTAQVLRVLGSPYVILDGLVIEGSGTFCLEFSQDSTFPTVRNTKLEYCRYGMQLPSNSLVEWNEYHYPGYYEFAEQVRALNGSMRMYDLVKNYQSGAFEGAIADTYGYSGTSRDCQFRYNYMHDAFDGESLGDFEYSESHHNVYLRNYDDHIEMESWAGIPSRELRLHDNLFLSTGLISHQETSLIGPHYVYRNVYYAPYDSHGAANWTIIKSKAPNATGGIFYYHNLLWGGNSELFWQEESRAHLHFRNNLIVFSHNSNSPTGTPLDADYNLLVNDSNLSFLYGSHGAYLGTGTTSLRFLDVAALNFGILTGSAAENRGVALPGYNDGAPGGPDVGPFETGFNPGGEWPRPRRTVYTSTPPERWNGGSPPPPDTTPPANVENLRRADDH